MSNPTAPAADPVAAWLAEAAELVAERDRLLGMLGYTSVQAKLADRTAVLVTVLEAVLALADSWDHDPETTINLATTRVEKRCAGALKAAIESALRDAQGGPQAQESSEEKRDG